MFNDRTRNNVEIIMKKLRTLDKNPEHIIKAINLLDHKFISVDQQVAFNILETLVQACQIDLCEDHMAKHGQVSESQVFDWANAEQFLI